MIRRTRLTSSPYVEVAVYRGRGKHTFVKHADVGSGAALLPQMNTKRDPTVGNLNRYPF